MVPEARGDETMAWPWLIPVLPALAFLLRLRQGRSSLLDTREDRMIVNPDTGRMILVGETASARTIYTVVSSCCLIILTLLLGKYASKLKLSAGLPADDCDGMCG